MGRSRKNTALARGPSTSDDPNKPTNRSAVSEHRRRQLRKAQQAYRQRKESTTLSLRNQVEALQRTVEELDRTFQTYHNKVESSDLSCSDLALRRTLQQIRQEFLAISGASGRNGDLRSPFRTNGSTSTVMQRSHRAGGTQQTEFESELAITARRVNRSPRLARRGSSFYMAVSEEINQACRLSSGRDSSTSTPSTVNCLNSPPCNVDCCIFPHIVSPAFLLSAPMPYFHESSFERRLHRACLKNGYDLLVDPTTDPENVRRVFRLPLAFSGRDSIVQRVQGILEVGLEEAPEMWDMPFFLLGGAGTHYPRRDQGGRPILPPNAVPMSKLISALAHQAAQPESVHSIEEFLAGLGLDGEWYDSYDVEGYLKEKGISLDGDISFCKVPEHVYHTEFPPPGAVSSNTLDIVQLEHSFQRYTNSGNADLSGIYSSGHLQPMTQVSCAQGIGQPWSDPNMNGSWTFDVNLFITHLIQSGLCFGRCPAFRREDVENTFRLAVCRSFLDPLV